MLEKKTCTKCNKTYKNPLTDHFHKKASAPDGLQYVCKKCIHEMHATHYLENIDYYKEKAVKHNAEYKGRNLQFVVDYLKQHPCVDCGETDPIVLEFDHLRNKRKEVSRLINDCVSIEILVEEIEKCEVRCANCHRRKTAKQFNWYEGIIL